MKAGTKIVKGLKAFIDGLSDEAAIIIRAISPYIIIQLLYYMALFVEEYKKSPSYAVYYYSDIFSGIFMSIFVLVIGAFFIDTYIKRISSAD